LKNAVYLVDKWVTKFLAPSTYNSTDGYVEDDPSKGAVVAWLQGDMSDSSTHSRLKDFLQKYLPGLGEMEVVDGVEGPEVVIYYNPTVDQSEDDLYPNHPDFEAYRNAPDEF